MRRILLKCLLTLLITTPMTHSLSAQNIVGQWKRSAMLTVYADGKTVDELPEITKEMPCTADIVYVFEASDNLTMRVPKGCPIPAVASTWKLNGNTLTTAMKGFTTTDQVSISGNTMTTTHEYGPQDKYVPKGMKALKVVYKKI